MFTGSKLTPSHFRSHRLKSVRFSLPPFFSPQPPGSQWHALAYRGVISSPCPTARWINDLIWIRSCPVCDQTFTPCLSAHEGFVLEPHLHTVQLKRTRTGRVDGDGNSPAILNAIFLWPAAAVSVSGVDFRNQTGNFVDLEWSVRHQLKDNACEVFFIPSWSWKEWVMERMLVPNPNLG